MRIAFDLDNTLIRCGHDFPHETPARPRWAKLLGGEQLRAGIRELAAHCRSQGWEIWVYTTSYRSAWHIRRLFWLYGISLDGIVNQQRHHREVQARCTKHPPTFGIDLLIDDSEGVRIEAERHGFRMLVVAPDDEQWMQKVSARPRTVCKDALLACKKGVFDLAGGGIGGGPTAKSLLSHLSFSHSVAVFGLIPLLPSASG